MLTALFRRSRGTLSKAPSLNNVAKEESSSQVDLRVHGVSQDDIYKDEERMTEIDCKTVIGDKSIIKDLKQEGVSSVFSEESKRKLEEMGNIDLFELSETVRTTQCPICLNHSQPGTIYCGSVMCLIPSQEHAENFKEESRSLQILCTLSSEEDKENATDLKSGNTITGSRRC